MAFVPFRRTSTISSCQPLSSLKECNNDKSILSGIMAAATVPSITNAFPSSIPRIIPTSIPTVDTTASTLHSILVATSTPMGELPSESGINPTFSTFGQWFFLIYVVVSLLAGGKEVFGRIVKQLDKKD
ncbi:hypothetical protein ACHAWO_006701 [Cyclotella atomus]|jgi:hypothetical protein|uniref:Uncharacterized protein n=1 Tax=Cyclotella atomus TaxID=382360 RepID=A0ABD3PEC5_9STRA